VVATGGPGLAQDALLPLLALCYWLPYWQRTRTLARQQRPVEPWRRWMYGAGLIVLLIALSPPLDKVSDRVLAAHMVEHLLIGDIAALMIVLGLTGPVLAPLLRIGAVNRLRVLIHPGIAAPLWALDFYVWHLPVLYQAALRHDGIHALQHACFLGFGIAMWMALLGPLPKPAWFGNAARLLYVVAVRLAGAVLGNILIWSHSAFYTYYVAAREEFGLSPLRDQGLAGAVMMIEGSLLTFGLFAWLFLRAARESDERQQLLDFASSHSLALDEQRAARAVAAGRGAELRARLEELAGNGAGEDRRDAVTPTG
jgi:cytochrome c oxidase assembly factor CtaG